MANTIELPNLKFFQWDRPNAANPRLAIGLGLSDTTIEVSNPPLDENDAVITGDFIFGVRNSAGYVENIYVPAGEVSVDGLTFTNVVRGINLTGLDYNTSVPSLIAKHEQDSPVFCNVTAVYESILAACLRGQSIRTNGVNFIQGTGNDETVTISRDDGTVRGFLRYDSVSNGVQYSNDGATWVSIAPAASSSLVAITASDTSPGYLNDKLVLNSNNLLAKTVLNPGAGETLQLTLPQTVIQNNTATYATATGSSNAYVLTLSPAVTAYAAGQGFSFLANFTNTGACTLNVNGLGARDLRLPNGTALVSGAIISGQIVEVRYDGTVFEVTGGIQNTNAILTSNNADGNLTITSGTTTINLSNSNLLVRNYNEISITGTGQLAFSNPNTAGSTIVLLCNKFTLTSSASPGINASGLGAAGGAAISGTATGGSGTIARDGVSGTNGLGIANFNSNFGQGSQANTSGSNGNGGAVPTALSFGTTINSYLQGLFPFSLVGAGGGSGGARWLNSTSSTTYASGVGGNGGGALVIICQGEVVFSGSISVAGANGGAGTMSSLVTDVVVGGGGGGGGGVCLLFGKTLTTTSGTITVSGGTGAITVGDGTPSVSGIGGGGGAGVLAGSNGSSGAVGGQSGGNGGAGLSAINQLI